MMKRRRLVSGLSAGSEVDTFRVLGAFMVTDKLTEQCSYHETYHRR
jgi:hypothetical protein